MVMTRMKMKMGKKSEEEPELVWDGRWGTI
jgi:hypothetical protein